MTESREISKPAKKPTTKRSAASTARSQNPSTSAARENRAVTQSVSAEERRRMIAVIAYHRAERRAFTTGHELDDWLASEKEVDALLSRAEKPSAG
jgi:hypothetical protein